MANRFKVVDGCNAYYLLDTVTNREACMGDGVDEPYGQTGTEEYRQAWEDEVNEDPETFEAYFPDLCDLVIFDNDNFIDRYTVIAGPASPIERSMRACATLRNCLGLSIDPGSPQGFSQWGTADPEFMAERNEKVHFLDLPENVQAYIARRLEDD